jgi:hypothetical protein
VDFRASQSFGMAVRLAIFAYRSLYQTSHIKFQPALKPLSQASHQLIYTKCVHAHAERSIYPLQAVTRINPEMCLKLILRDQTFAIILHEAIHFLTHLRVSPLGHIARAGYLHGGERWAEIQISCFKVFCSNPSARLDSSWDFGSSGKLFRVSIRFILFVSSDEAFKPEQKRQHEPSAHSWGKGENAMRIVENPN